MDFAALKLEVEKFRREVSVRNGTDDQAFLVLFAYAAEPTAQRYPILDYVEAFLGPPVRRSSNPSSFVLNSGTVKFRTVARRVINDQQFVQIKLSPATVNDINAMLEGSHPLSKIEPDHKFTFECGKELCHINVQFDDGSVMVVAVSRGIDYIGVEHYLVKDGNMLATCGVPVDYKTILGTYAHQVSNDEDESPSAATHVVEILEGE